MEFQAKFRNSGKCAELPPGHRSHAVLLRPHRFQRAGRLARWLRRFNAPGQVILWVKISPMVSELTRRFATERTRRFREGKLNKRDERTISNVEKFGCEVVQVKRNSAGPGWSYALGVYDTCGQPDVVTV